MPLRRLICDHCAGRIGVYEPVIVVEEDQARETSKAAEPELPVLPGRRYHKSCYIAHLAVSAV